MPPRVQPHRISTPTSCQCFRTRPRQHADGLPSRVQVRSLHPPGYINPKTPLPRRVMFEWLHGPGKVFREPLANSTNYMSAYDKYGELLRSRRGREEQSEEIVPLDMEEAIQKKEIEDKIDEGERHTRFRARQDARDRRGSRLPKERPNDLRPYPLNQHFRSQSVLSEELREAVYAQVAIAGLDISAVAAAFNIDTRRVAAVVRLKTIEKQWADEGKTLAKPYHDAVMAMLPQTAYNPNSPEKMVPHESINDLPVHARTRSQMFWPASESRQFTREDAAKAFDDRLLPADKRIAHPELIEMTKDELAGLDRSTRITRQQERDQIATQKREDAEAKRKKWEERTQRIVPGRRWDFKFQDFNAEKTGKDGRARNAVGVRYGMPHEDRKRGLVKIPTSVE